MSCIDRFRKEQMNFLIELSLELIVLLQSYCVYSFAERDTDAIEEREGGRKREREGGQVFTCVGVGLHRERDVGH